MPVKKATKKVLKKKTVRKKTPAKKSPKKVLKKKPVRLPKAEKPVGKVTHFFGNIKVAIVKFKVPVTKGTAVRFQGATTNFVQTIASMQFDHKPVARAIKGKEIGIKVSKKVRQGDSVFKAT